MIDKSGERAELNGYEAQRSARTKTALSPSASRRDASVVDAISCTTESSLRDSIIINHAYPTTPLRSMAGYFQRALRAPMGKHDIGLLTQPH